MPMDKIRVSLRSLDTMPDAFAIIVGRIPVDASGTLSAHDIASARYAVQVSGLPENACVADVRQGGISVFNTGFFFTGVCQFVTWMRPISLPVEA
jgi:hypothetical protein